LKIDVKKKTFNFISQGYSKKKQADLHVENLKIDMNLLKNAVPFVKVLSNKS